MRGNVVGVDVGGTKIAAGVIDLDGAIIDSTRRDTPALDPVAILDVIVDAVEELTVDHDVAAVGVGAAGFVSADRSTVLFAPNIAWRDEGLGSALQSRIGLPAVVENDANSAAWAESRFGAGRGHDDLAVLTVGTGIGGGVVLGGRLLRGGFGAASEVGHIIMVPNGRLCGCGLQGCLEQYGSGRALVAKGREVARHSPTAARELLLAAGGDPEAITGNSITSAALHGDEFALSCIDEIAYWLGRGLAQLAAVLDPSLFVIGGGVSASGEILRSRVEEVFRTHLTGRGHRPVAEIRIAELGGEAGMVGAADLARTEPVEERQALSNEE